jgi:hypothetical protein
MTGTRIAFEVRRAQREVGRAAYRRRDGLAHITNLPKSFHLRCVSVQSAAMEELNRLQDSIEAADLWELDRFKERAMQVRTSFMIGVKYKGCVHTHRRKSFFVLYSISFRFIGVTLPTGRRCPACTEWRYDAQSTLALSTRN